MLEPVTENYANNKIDQPMPAKGFGIFSSLALP